MSVLNGVVAMELDSMGYEEPSTPLRDPTSSPAVHIQWQNSQSACAAMEELRVASSVPRRPPKPLTFDFELPASAVAGPSSPHGRGSSDPFSSSSSRTRQRLRSARSRNIDRVQSRSQNDIFATTPAADASKFLAMLGRASARVDENSRKRMRALASGGGERARGTTKRSVMKGKTRGTRSMDELGDHTNFVLRDTLLPETGVHYSSLPLMLESQAKDTAMQGYKNDVHMHNGTSAATAAAVTVPVPGNDGVKLPVSTRPQNGTQLFPPRATLSTRHSQKRTEPPSPTPVRPSAHPIPLRPARPRSDRTSDSVPPLPPPPLLPHASVTHSQQSHPARVSTPLPPAVNDVLKGGGLLITDSIARPGSSRSTSTASATSTSTSLISAHPPPSQTHGHGSKRALGMTRTVPRSFASTSSSSNNTPHSAATKKPFRPPLARPAAAASQVTTAVPASSARPHDSQRQRRQEEGGSSSKKGSGADPDSSFDISFDFDPEALEAAMKQYD